MSAPIDLTAAPDVSPPGSSHAQTSPHPKQDVVLDILYENQRGAWFFGLPLFSSASLLNFDPAPWCNAHGKPSPVNVTNAQTPDPSWQWAWPTWYVDMSADVDEEGWQYSLGFRKGRAWHGTHPWFHSFVRRRRWVRMRRKGGKRHANEPPSEGQRAAEKAREAHLLNADYFTIHPVKTTDQASTYAPTLTKTKSGHPENLRLVPEDAEDEGEEEEIDNLQALFARLKKATVDREKINMVLQFLDQGGQDVYYLSDQMSHILSMFVFQYTRRQLLSRMLAKITEASEKRADHDKKGTEESALEKQKIDELLKAIDAAEDEVKSLEYWSDIRDMVQAGETVHGIDPQEGWTDWQGLDQSGAVQASSPRVARDGHIGEEAERTPGEPETGGDAS
ncbi:MAG: hypothetical protein Q9162_004596 [Coniocarpon cinnabarinum]